MESKKICCNHDCNQGRTCPNKSRIIDAVNQTKQDMKGNNMKEEALKLADELADKTFWQNPEARFVSDKASAMIRRLVEELNETQKKYDFVRENDAYLRSEFQLQGKRIRNLIEHNNFLDKQTKPLNDEEIFQISKTMPKANIYDFARAIEERHGIK